MSLTEVTLPSAPTDAISSVAFCASTDPDADSDRLLVSSWDAHLRLYDLPRARLAGLYPHPAALFAVTPHPFNHEQAFTAGLDRRVRAIALTRPNDPTHDILATAQAPVRALKFVREHNVLLAGAWDHTLRLVDPRQPPPPSNNSAAALLTLSDKVHALDVHGSTAVVAFGPRKWAVLDLRKPDLALAMHTNNDQTNQIEGFGERESSFKYMTRAIRCMPSGQGFATGSIEGRIAVEFYNKEPAVQAQRYAFKCHRTTTADGQDRIYPVNAIAFHPIHGTFASAGADGCVCLWDAAAKKRLKNYSIAQTAISAIDFSDKGDLLAIASSYGFERGGAEDAGEAAANPPSIIIKNVAADCKPKAKA